MSYRFRHSICNECFQDWSFADTCKAVRKAGYDGIEIAPFTLADRPSAVTAAQRAECRSIMQGEGLQFVGLHWLMVSPKGLHVTTPDQARRKQGWEHVRQLVDLCVDLGENGVLVFGSPAQRGATGGISPVEATRHFVEGVISIAAHVEERGATLLIEALPTNQTNVIVSLAETVSLVDEIASPAVRTMFDTHNAVEEAEPHEVLVDRYFDYIRHVHVNETDGRHCGQGDYNFRPLLQVLKNRDYKGWVSLECFDFSPGAERIANESLRFLEAEIAKLD